MTTFWSLWIIVITVGTLVGCAILLTWCAKDKMGVEAEPHDLVVAIAREGRAEPQEQQQEERGLGQQPEDAGHPGEPGLEPGPLERRQPAAHEDRSYFTYMYQRTL